MKAYGVCPGSCGEFVQGFVDNEEYLCSYAINKFSRVKVIEELGNINLGPKKARMALERTFKHFKLDLKESRNISIILNSDIPIGKGMASSTADIAATIRATSNLLGKNISEAEVVYIASTIEATDSIVLSECSMINPINGQIIKKLGNINGAKILALEPQYTLETKSIRERTDYKKLKVANKEIVSEAFKLLEEGIKNNNFNTIGRAITFSALANENIHKKLYLKKIIDIANSFGAYGVNVAHSGTVIGILLDKDMNEELLKNKLQHFGIHKEYNKIYALDILEGEKFIYK